MTTYTNPRLSATIDNWPSGAKRVTAVFTIETHPTRGQRATRTTTGATKVLTYARQMRIVDGDDGRTYILALTNYGHISVHKGDMKFSHESIHDNDPRYPAVLALFQNWPKQPTE